MATYAPEVIEQLRRRIDDTSEPYTYDTDTLAAYLDAANGDLDAVAARIWREKAARYAGLVDVQEGNSRRALSKLYEQALAMAGEYGPGDTAGSWPMTVPIVRP